MKGLFSRSLTAMVQTGLAYQTNPDSDTYESISFQKNLGQDVLRLIREGTHEQDQRALQMTDTQLGVTEDFIFEKLRQQLKYTHVLKHQLHSTIMRWIEENEVYSCGLNEYRSY